MQRRVRGLAPRHLEPIMLMSLLASECVDSTVTAEPAAIVPVNASAPERIHREKISESSWTVCLSFSSVCCRAARCRECSGAWPGRAARAGCAGG